MVNRLASPRNSQAKQEKTKVDGKPEEDASEATGSKTESKTNKRKAELELEVEPVATSSTTKDEETAASSSKKQKKEKKNKNLIDASTSTTTETDGNPQPSEPTPTSTEPTTSLATVPTSTSTSEQPKQPKKSKKLKSAAAQSRPPTTDDAKPSASEQKEESTQEVKEVTHPGEDGSLDEQSIKGRSFVCVVRFGLRVVADFFPVHFITLGTIYHVFFSRYFRTLPCHTRLPHRRHDRLHRATATTPRQPCNTPTSTARINETRPSSGSSTRPGKGGY